ncbi:hypothetical protein DFH27DRAFT_33868 [Peziza echinospora]|nr:hypothetical protein DFH27DRAFT_33868 [Peziza echinospora]
MSGRPSRSWRSKSVILPIALSVAATAATIGLWLWLDDSGHDHSHSHSHSHDHSDSEHDSDAGAYTGSSKRRPNLVHGSSSSSKPGRGSSSPSASAGPALVGGSSSNLPAQLPRVDEESEPGSVHGGSRHRPSASSPIGITSPSGPRNTQYSLPPKTRTVVFVVCADSVNGASTLLSSLPQSLTIPPGTTLHILIHTPALTHPPLNPENTSFAPPPPPPLGKVHEIAYSILPVTYPKEYILTYTTHPTGTVSLVRHLTPEIVYMEETMAGNGGSVLRELLEKGWIREGVVVLGTGPGAVGGKGDGGLAGLVDSSDEEDGLEKISYGEASIDGKGKEKDTSGRVSNKSKRWWTSPGWDGVRGGGNVVERAFLADDWNRRVVESK